MVIDTTSINKAPEGIGNLFIATQKIDCFQYRIKYLIYMGSSIIRLPPAGNFEKRGKSKKLKR
jgi:hypothetical protein